MLSKIKLEKQFLSIASLMVLVNIILELYYVLFLTTQFNYFGFELNLSIIKYIEIKLYLIGLLYLSYKLYKKSPFLFAVFMVLMLFFFIPNSIIYAYMDHIRGPVYSSLLVLLLFFCIAPIRISWLQKIRIKAKLPTSIIISSIALLLLIPVVLIFKFDINLKTLLLQEIYETRAVFSEKLTRIANYFYNWEVKIVVPVLLAFFLIKKKYILAAISFLILIYLFVISGNKAVYASSFVTLFFYFVGGKSFTQKIKLLLLFLIIALLGIPLLDEYVFNGILFRGTFVMRVFFFPALLNYCYFDFFNDVSLHFSENHLFNLFFHSPYDVHSAYLISKEYFDTNEMYANNGIISDGFINWGYLGVGFLATGLSLIFTFFNGLKIDARYFGIFFIFAFFVLSTPLLTVISTGGLWLLILLGFLIFKQD